MVPPAPERKAIRKRKTAPRELAYGEASGKGQKNTLPLNPENREHYVDFLYYLHAGRNLRERSCQTAASAVHQFLSFCQHFGLPTAADIEKRHIETWLHALENGVPLVATEESRGLSNDPPLRRYEGATVQNRYKHLNIFYKWMSAGDEEEDRRMARNPMRNIPFPKADKKVKPVATREQLEELWNSLRNRRVEGKLKPNWRDLAICGFLYDTGMRASELANLKDANIEPEGAGEGMVYIPGDGLGTKGRKFRWVQVGYDTLSAYRQYRRSIETDHFCPETAFVSMSDWRELSGHGVYQIVAAHWRAIGLNYGAHTFRHTAATHIVEEGSMTETQIKQMFGWESYDQVLVYTGNANKQKAAEAAQRARVGFAGILPQRRR